MIDIRLHNTLTGKKELFKPVKEGRVGMYHCGPTVYNYVHIGNLRSFFLADITRRLFETAEYEVTQVMNVTDVGMLGDNDDEDKMTQGLKREGKPLTLEAMKELADFYAKAFVKDIEALNIKIPNRIPKASEHITEDIEVVKKLEAKGLTYTTSDGVYFDTSKIKDYGKLGGVKQSDDSTQSRIGLNSEKRNPRDFSLWKLNPNLGWESPWGKGFPGWHIECSAMSMKYLGETFDIHTGGIDLAPIHHNNEIAQSEHATGKEFAHYWLHNAFINVGEAKMAKSAGNFLTLSSLTDKGYDPMAYRYFLLGARYSTPMNFTWEALDAAANAYKKLINQICELPEGGTANKGLFEKALSYVADDLDTPKALALCWDIMKDDSVSPADKRATLLAIDQLLGLGKPKPAEEIPAAVLALMKEREGARAAKDFKKSDELRDKIAALGYVIKDMPDGQKISKK
ncbi:MAG TPA: cysteine--tRNA ligase [Candidatus Paceibacterota bacterium]|nr:cysteine--tRNA ligase [Candidatus Paceibacterota bacterium]